MVVYTSKHRSRFLSEDLKKVISLRYTRNITDEKNAPTTVQKMPYCVIKAIEISHNVKETAEETIQQAETSSKLTSAQCVL